MTPKIGAVFQKGVYPAIPVVIADLKKIGLLLADRVKRGAVRYAINPLFHFRQGGVSATPKVASAPPLYKWRDTKWRDFKGCTRAYART